MNEEIEDLLKFCKEAMMEARMSNYTNTSKLRDAEIEIKDYLDMAEALYEGYSNLDKLWRD